MKSEVLKPEVRRAKWKFEVSQKLEVPRKVEVGGKPRLQPYYFLLTSSFYFALLTSNFLTSDFKRQTSNFRINRLPLLPVIYRDTAMNG